jgi:hypothetical protein
VPLAARCGGGNGRGGSYRPLVQGNSLFHPHNLLFLAPLTQRLRDPRFFAAVEKQVRLLGAVAKLPGDFNDVVILGHVRNPLIRG